MDSMYRISVDELAFALSLLGEPEAGSDLLQAHLGELPAEEIDAHFHAAAHSLLARGWVEMGGDLEIFLHDAFRSILEVVVDSEFSIQYRRSGEVGEYVLTYHFKKGEAYKHSVEFGVVHEIKKTKGTGSVIDGGMDFFEMDSMKSFVAPTFSVPYEAFEPLLDLELADEVSDRLDAMGMPDRTRDLLAQDFPAATHRGGIMRIEYPDDGEPVSELGLLTLQTPQRLWLLKVDGHDRESQLEIHAGTKKAFKTEVMGLIEA